MNGVVEASSALARVDSPLILCADVDEAERLAMRDLRAISFAREGLNTAALAPYRGATVYVTPRARNHTAAGMLFALGCDVRALDPSFNLESGDPAACGSSAMFPRIGRVDDDTAADGECGDDRGSLRPLRIEELLQRPAPRWLVRGLLPERGFAVMFGASGSGKTFLALDLAACVARGAPWFDRRARAGGVIYVAAEGHLKLRLLAYLQHHALEAPALTELRIVPATINLLRMESGDLDALTAEIKRTAKEIGGIVLVVLDTLNSMMPGGNENASDDMGAMIAAARRMMAVIDCAVLYIHHSGKDETKGSRGHSSLKAAVDCELQVTGDTERVLEAVKIRDGEPGQQFGFRLHSIDLGPDGEDPDAQPGEHIGSCVVTPLASVPPKPKAKVRRDVALDALRETLSELGELLPGTSTIPPGSKAVTLNQWRTRWALRTGYDDSGGDSLRVNFDKDRRALLSAGAIMISKPYVWIAAR